MSMQGIEELEFEGETSFVAPNEVEWKILDFLSLPEEIGYSFESLDFAFGEGTWCFRCCPNRHYSGITLYLKRKRSVLKHMMSFRVGIKANNGFELSVANEGIFQSEGEECGTDLYVERSLLLKQKNTLVPEGILTFFCRFESEPSAEASSQAVVEGTDKLAQDLKYAFLESYQCDLTIKVLDQEFRAHKFILSLRSPVFKAMLTHDTVEKETGIITIEDVEPEVFRVLLMFLYSGKLENASNGNVTDFYIIADKYQVEEMKSECMKFMMRNMSDETFGDFLSLALTYNNKELLETATNYFAKNMKTIIKTVTWQSFLEEHATEANELLNRAVNHPKQN